MSQRRDDARCGTPSGWNRHRRNGERPCERCVDAKAAYDRRWRAAPERTRRNRRLARARGLALQRLSHRYPEEYSELYREALTELESERDD